MLTVISVPRLAAVLMLFASLAVSQTSSPDSFEVASVKPLGPVPAGGGRDTNASGGAGQGCDGGFPRLDRSHFSVTTTPYALITWAYGYNKTWGCSYVSFGDLLTGGPSWIRSERFQIEATIPAGATPYTLDQFMKGDAPGLEQMLRALLRDRFGLRVHKQTMSVAGYSLIPAKGGPKVVKSASGDQRMFGIRREEGPNGQIVNRMIARRVEMRDLAFLLLLTVQRPVIDETGLAGEFNFEMEFAPFESDGATDSSAPSLFTAIQQQLGLTLKTTRASLDGLAIDDAVRPGEN
jgi:uncharacterized protein (TIGR03435 family)